VSMLETTHIKQQSTGNGFVKISALGLSKRHIQNCSPVSSRGCSVAHPKLPITNQFLRRSCSVSGWDTEGNEMLMVTLTNFHNSNFLSVPVIAYSNYSHYIQIFFRFTANFKDIKMNLDTAIRVRCDLPS